MTGDRYEITRNNGVRWWSTIGHRYEITRNGVFVTIADTRWGARHAIKADKRTRAKGTTVIYREDTH
jgi:hypothetical protein